MSMIRDTPWDTTALGMYTAEIVEYSKAALDKASRIPGHYTIKVDPMANKRLLHENGFYYCDTLIEPHCTSQELVRIEHPNSTISRQTEWEELFRICHGAFKYGRFHRDFGLDKLRADLRYDNWLRQLYEKDAVFGLFWRNGLAGFIAYDDNKLVLHALAENQRGLGRAKYWWSAVCSELLAAGHEEVKSSVSGANLAALNLYASLGFSFSKSIDVYHRLIE